MDVRPPGEQPSDHGLAVKALVIVEPGRMRVGELPEPAPGRGDLLLRVRTVGFCGSDLSTFRGLNPLVSYPRVPGHEIAATVEEIGTEVPEGRFRQGMRVTVLPYTACDHCPSCRRGRANACRDNQTLGVQRDGAFTEWIVAPWRNVIVAEGLPLSALALIEPLSVGRHAAGRGRVGAGERVAVFGCGAVGLGAIAGAAAAGAEVIAVDVDDRKLQLARNSGAMHLVNSRAAPLAESLRALTADDGPDLIIEAVGVPETYIAAVEETAFAGRVVFIGYAREPIVFQTAQIVKKELDIHGSRNATAADFNAVLELLRTRSFPVTDAVSRVVSLEEAPGALREWSADPGPITRIHVNLA